MRCVFRVGMALTNRKAWNIKCILILNFLMVMGHGVCTPKRIWQDSGKVVFSTWRLTQPRIWRGTKGCLVAWFSLSSGIRSWKRGVQAYEASRDSHQQSNNTTDDRPRGKPRTPSPLAWRLPNGSCSHGKISRLECLHHSGVFLFEKQSSIQRTLPGKEWNGTKVELTQRKETYHSCAVVPGGTKICHQDCSGLSSKRGLCGLPKRRKASIAAVNNEPLLIL